MKYKKLSLVGMNSQSGDEISVEVTEFRNVFDWDNAVAINHGFQQGFMCNRKRKLLDVWQKRWRDCWWSE